MANQYRQAEREAQQELFKLKQMYNITETIPDLNGAVEALLAIAEQSPKTKRIECLSNEFVFTQQKLCTFDATRVEVSHYTKAFYEGIEPTHLAPAAEN